jgi:SAM-dependent methyltransferase
MTIKHSLDATDLFYERTQNQMGYMTTLIDEIGHAFLKFAETTSSNVLDIGAAYGHVVLEAARRNISIIANDLDPHHLEILYERASETQRSFITLLPGRFPEELYFEPNSLGAVLICRVLHFFAPEAWINAVRVIHSWLEPGGKLFMTNESPYFGTMKKFLPVYLARKRNKHPWPGLMTGMEYFDDHRKKDVNALINLLSVSETQSVLEDVGFKIESIQYLDRKGIYPPDALYDGRETVAVIAVKP